MRSARGQRSRAALAIAPAAVALALSPAARAADAFNGRIAFASTRADPAAGQERSTDIFTISPDGTGLRRLTSNPAEDRQPDWSPDGRAIAYTIGKPGSPVNFEVARMTGAGADVRRLTTTEAGQASSQPSWAPGGGAILFRRSGPGLVSTIWQMGALGESPAVRFGAPRPALYPSWAPDGRRVLFTAVMSATGDSDRAIFTVEADGSGQRTLFDVPGAFDSAPAWSPDGTRVAYESNADVGGANPEGDMEIWTMAADGSAPAQLTRNAAHDEGPAWSPDGELLAFTSGPDDEHGDIHIMTATGDHVRRITRYLGLDESPDWERIPAPRTDKRCGDAVTSGAGAHDVRARRGVACRDALALARRWVRAGRPARVRGFAVAVADYGGTRRVVLTRGRRLVAFLHQAGTAAG